MWVYSRFRISRSDFTSLICATGDLQGSEQGAKSGCFREHTFREYVIVIQGRGAQKMPVSLINLISAVKARTE